MPKHSAVFLPVVTGTFRKLSPNELASRGMSRKAERYVSDTGETITKRRYQESQLQERYGKRITLATRARNYFSGVWTYLTGGAKKAAEARRKKQKKIKIIGGRIGRGGRRTIEDSPKHLAEIKSISLTRGNMSRKDYLYIRKLMKIYGREEILVYLSPEVTRKAA